MANHGNLVRYESEGGIATLTLNAPPANTYSYEMNRELDDAILEARFDDSVHVIVLTGTSRDKPGKADFFCSGADIAVLAESQPSFKYNFCLHANETLNRLEHTSKLVIAALNGHCVGGGLEVAMAADIRLARRDAGKIGLPEVNLGVLPGTGGTQRLSRLLGKARSMELLITGDLMSFEQARDLGLVNAILDNDGFADQVRDWASRFLPPGKASRAVGHIKRAVQSGLEIPFESGLALERELQQRLFESADAREGIAAYVEKRKPAFSGQ